MSATKIALCQPGPSESSRYFLVNIKKSLANEPSEYQQTSKLLVLSYIGGNFRAFQKFLIRAGVMDRRHRWTFEDGHLIIEGNFFKHGELEIECLWLIYSLEERAIKRGGYVHFILGEQDITHLNGKWRHTHPKYANQVGLFNRSFAALYDGNNELWRWLRTKNIMEKIGNILFVHGGISDEIIDLNLSINEINSLVRLYYTKANDAMFTSDQRIRIFLGENSPFRYKGYLERVVTSEQIDSTLSRFKVNTIVTGHSISVKATPYFDGKVINVYTDNTTGKSEVLLIRGSNFYRMDESGKRKRIK